MRTFVLFLLALGLPAAAAEPAPPAKPNLLAIGNYMTSLGGVSVSGMASTLLDACGAYPGLTPLGFSANAHASEAENWEAGYASWFTGAGANDSPHADVRSERTAAKGRKPALAMLQVEAGWGRDPKSAEEPKVKARREAIGKFAAAAKAAQVPLILYVLPDRQNTTGDKKSGKPATEEQYQQALAPVHATALALAREHGVPVAPTYLAFAELRRIRPELSLHAPRSAEDGHLSPRDAALCAATVAAAALGKRPEKTATAEQVLADYNRYVERAKAKNKASGKPDSESLASLSAEEWKAVNDAAWAAVERFRADLAKDAPKAP